MTREIYITTHCIERAKLRHPEFLRARGVGGMYAEVREALRDGRRAKTQPRWATRDGRRRKIDRAHGEGIFVWNREETRCYALRRGMTAGGRGWHVRTMLSNESERNHREES